MMAAGEYRRYTLGQLGHIAYERGEMEHARDLFRQAGRHLDSVGVVRLIAASAPRFVREPMRWCWRRLQEARA
jgi:hypothetical protein